MDTNKKKFAFIICTNDEMFFEECCFYINRLLVPKGYSAEIIPIRDAKSICSGYNRGMDLTDAKYKIYMHQDVFILNKNFLRDILTIFKQNSKIGMIGMVGSPKLPTSCIPWYGERVGNLYEIDNEKNNYNEYDFSKDGGYCEVEAIDGLMMITKEDIPWREDLFDGWDFYDSSQSFEFIRKGFKVVVPVQTVPWCAHEDGIMNLWSYNKYRKIFMNEYRTKMSDSK